MASRDPHTSLCLSNLSRHTVNRGPFKQRFSNMDSDWLATQTPVNQMPFQIILVKIVQENVSSRL